MRNREGIKSMPYKLEEGAMERMKIRANAAIAQQSVATARHASNFRWAISFAALLVIGIAMWSYLEVDESTNYQVLMDQIAEAPVDVLYEISADYVEYEEDVTLL